MGHWEPYPYQKRVSDLILEGMSVILQAPTGSGKTAAALMPFLYARQNLPAQDFPRKCIYSVPLRILATQFYDEYSSINQKYGWSDALSMSLQTGSLGLDTKFEGDLIFTTIDQTLSSFLNIPYDLSNRQANLNTGAIFSSYLVFDELHLLDPETSLPTTLYLLKMLKGIAPFLIMSATFSEEMVHSIARLLDAVPLVLEKEEASALRSQQKTRRIHYVDRPLSAEAILSTHKECARSIVICNTVDRTQHLYRELKSRVGPNTVVELIHSRFLQRHRIAKEKWLQREFGRNKESYQVRSAILVATQVIEVGIDVTCDVLHTELAPAANIIQRAGRCARYAGEHGNVYVYSLPLDQHGKSAYAPYHEPGQKQICERSRQAFEAPERNGQLIDFNGEIDIVNQAHREADKGLLRQLQDGRSILREKIHHTIQTQDRGAASDLIRDIDSCAVIVHPNPEQMVDPWRYENFQIFRGSLSGAYEQLVALSKQIDAAWTLKMAQPNQDEGSQEGNGWKWIDVSGKRELSGCMLVAINPALVDYSAAIGYQLAAAGKSGFCSPQANKSGKPYREIKYCRETYVEHVSRLLNAYQNRLYDEHAGVYRQSLADEVAFISTRLERKNGWPLGTLDRLIRLVIALHDLGKLDVVWQKWAREWQKQVSGLRGEDLTIPDEYMAVHTDYDSTYKAERLANRQLGPRPDHAVESAAAAYEYFKTEMNREPSLVYAAMTAVACHHSAAVGGNSRNGFRAHLAAPKEIYRALKKSGFTPDLRLIKFKFSPEEAAVSRRMIDYNDADQLIAYLLVCRVLRLADQRSQEMKR